MFLTFQEIQKIVVFEGAFEKIFGIIKEEGGSEGGVVVQVFKYLVYILWHFSLIVAQKPFSLHSSSLVTGTWQS